ncbi:MAG TPA: NAD(P)-binding domain-containing protein [Chloroflexota bacterium]|nr:NAD(P)-binding domain-containing protein [Chloroflexota bacterium]
MAASPRACIIGAGSSGITAVKALHDAGIPFDCYEKSDCIGGNWAFGNKNGMSAAYRTLHINSSRDSMQYADYPMPKTLPFFPHHTHIAAYFNDYVDHFGLRDKITFNTGVEHAERRPDGRWAIRLEDGTVHDYDALLVASGHHWDPRWPDPPFPGHFDGTQMHAHAYRDNAMLSGKRVVVVGMGNSAMDIAVESSYVAQHTYLSARRGAYVIPKYLFGRPGDLLPFPLNLGDPRIPQRLRRRIPWRVRQTVMQRVLRLAVGRPEQYGLPRPEHGILQAHPTVSDTILSRLAHRAITPKPTIAELLGHRVRFVDGSLEEVDVIVYCTGYKISFPFFDPDFISAPDNDLPRFMRVFMPDINNVFFVGFVQPWGAIMPIAEVQAKWVADYLRGIYALPSPPAMRAAMESERSEMFERYVSSRRHTMQVDVGDYLYDVAQERNAGAERARRRTLAAAGHG